MFSSLHYSAVYNKHVPVLSDYFFGEDRVVRAAVDQARVRGRVASSHFRLRSSLIHQLSSLSIITQTTSNSSKHTSKMAPRVSVKRYILHLIPIHFTI